MLFQSFPTSGLFYEVAHHLVALLGRVLSMAEVARHKVEEMVLENAVELDSSLVADHAEEAISIRAYFRVSNVRRVLAFDENDHHDLPHC